MCECNLGITRCNKWFGRAGKRHWRRGKCSIGDTTRCKSNCQKSRYLEKKTIWDSVGKQLLCNCGTSTLIETHYHNFSVYFNDEFLEKVTEYTNRYHVAEKGKALGASVAEMKIFFWYCHWHGLHLLSKATHVLGENHKTSYCSWYHESWSILSLAHMSTCGRQQWSNGCRETIKHIF